MKVYMLLDRSGSMATRWVEAISSINAYAAELAKKPETAGAEITLIAFDEQGGASFHEMARSVSVSSWRPIDPNAIGPRGGTPLYDAIGKIVAIAEAEKPDRATIVVTTDGQENASREVRREAAKSLLDRCRDKGWDVVFLGVDFDAMAQGASLGNTADMTLNASAATMDAAMAGLAAKTASYAATGTTRAFMQSERDAAAGKAK